MTCLEIKVFWSASLPWDAYEDDGTTPAPPDLTV
jgi:hypothetical protein